MVKLTPQQIADRINGAFHADVTTIDMMGDIKIVYHGTVNGKTVDINEWLFCLGDLFPYIWYYSTDTERNIRFHSFKNDNMNQDAVCINPEIKMYDVHRDNHEPGYYSYWDLENEGILDEFLTALCTYLGIAKVEILPVFEEELAI